MERLLDRQLRSVRDAATGSIDLDSFVGLVKKTYEEFERERRLNLRASRLMEEELLEANAKMERESSLIIDTLTRNVREGIIVTTVDGIPISANPAACKMFGYTADGEINCPVDYLLHVPVAEKIGDGRVVETRAFPASGPTFPIELSVTEYEIDGKRQKLWLIRDISERKAKEHALKAAKEAAEDANRLKSQFLATMSHELRTPLNAILGFAEVIRDQMFGEGATQRYRDYANDIFTSGTHLLALINDILDLSKIEAGGYPLKKEAINLNDLANECALFIQPVIKRKSLAFDMDLPEASYFLTGDRRSLKQILLNLLSNAAKFTPTHGKVSLLVHPLNNHVFITVTDTGIGIAANDLADLFEPFRQANETVARKFGGTGLGLTISKKLIELHGGKINIESEPGKGTQVQVILPADTAMLEPVSHLAILRR
jgi:PAS domain S-box-containing protein